MLINGMADELQCALLLNTHTSKTYNPGNPDFAHAGTMAWQNHARAVVELTRQQDDAPPLLKLIKRNLVGPQSDIAFKWTPEGLLLPDLPELDIIGTIKRRNAEKVFLDLLDKLTAENRPLSSSNRAGNYAPKIFALRPPSDRDDFKRRDFEIAMESLFQRSEIILQSYGRKSDERSKIVRKTKPEKDEAS
jgi:hypothetical protein